METLEILLLFALGLVLIVKGGDWFVDAASWMAEISGIPKLIIGATIVSLATTLPEMLVSVMAATEGKVDMSIGNAVGSVTANLGLIFAVSVLFIPAAIRRGDYLVKSGLMLAAAALLVACGLSGSVAIHFCVLLLALFAAFFYENLRAAVAATSRARETREKASGRELAFNIGKFAVGAAGIVIGADLLVDNGSALALLLGVSERVIGVTIVAIGTSLPELVTTLTAIAKKQSSLSVGNILGANILDLTLILPISSLVAGKPLPVGAVSASLDLPACLLVGCIAVIPALISQKFRRVQGVALLAVYAVYVYLTCVA